MLIPRAPPLNPSLKLIVLSAGIGLWTSLIMLDSGTYLLMSLVLVGGLALQQASAVKAVMIGAAAVCDVGRVHPQRPDGLGGCDAADAR